MKNISAVIALMAIGLLGYGQADWDLKTDNDGIKVYTKTFPDSKFKAIRVEVELDASLSQLVAVVMDVNTGSDWLYATKTSKLIKELSPGELIYYSEVRLPWPISNRDFIAQLKASQDTRTKVVTIDGPTIPDYVPVKDGIVRITRAEGRWVITPAGPHHIKVQYTLRTDPGGDLPAWLFNLFVTKGPAESFKNLLEQLKKPAYANVHLPYIVD